MAVKKRREVTVCRKPNIKAQYKAFRALYPEIMDTIKVFNENKRRIPPERLPARMQDHVLSGKLAGVRECHLAADVLLLYTHSDDLVTMLYICRHEDLYGRRGKQLATNVSTLLN